MAEINFEGTTVRWGEIETPESVAPNVIMGAGTGTALTDKGEANVAVGAAALASATTGSSNVAHGNEALKHTTTGIANVAVGRAALMKTTEGLGNVAVGEGAGESNTTTNANIYIGYRSGVKNEGTGNIFLGYESGQPETATSNKLIIANNKSAAIIKGVMSATEASQEIGFLGHAPVKRPKVTGNKTTEIPAVLKHICEALSELGLITDETT